jgi:hypothetical protein
MCLFSRNRVKHRESSLVSLLVACQANSIFFKNGDKEDTQVTK